MSSPVICRGIKLTFVVFLGFLFSPLIIIVSTCVLISFSLFLPALWMFIIAIFVYKILVKRKPFRYVATSILNLCLSVLDDWTSKTNEMFLKGLNDNQVSVELDPLEFPYPEESESESEEEGMRRKRKESESQTLEDLKSDKRELNPVQFYNLLSFWKIKEAKDVGVKDETSGTTTMARPSIDNCMPVQASPD